MGGRAFGPPLCRGCAPATPPSKTIAHQPYAFIPAVRLKQGGCPQPIAIRDSLNDSLNVLRGSDGVALSGPSWMKKLVKKKEVAVASSWSFVALSGPPWTKRSCSSSRPFAPLRKRCCRCSCRPSWPLAALRGQKEVAVAVLRPSLPVASWSLALSGPSWTKRSCRCR